MSQPIRVLMITSDWPTPGQPRTTYFIKRQAEFLQAAGVLVDVFHFRGRRNPWNYLSAWWRLRRRLARNYYDLVHAQDRKSTRLNSSHGYISYAVFCFKKKTRQEHAPRPGRPRHLA